MLRRKLADKLQAEYTHACRQVREEKEALQQAEENLLHATEAQSIVVQLAQTVQQQAHDRIASVVTKCLEAIFEERYQFRIHFERKRGRTEAKLHFLEDGHEIDPTEEGSGGVLDVGAFALRLASLMLVRPKLRRLFVADEPFRFVGAENAERIPALLNELAETLGMQIVMVTHSPLLRTGKVIRIERQK